MGWLTSSALLVATLTLYHGRVTNRVTINEVEGVAVLNLGGTAMTSHFFDCHTSQGSPSDLRWTKEEGTLRFPMEVVGPFEYPDGQLRRVLRMDLAPTQGGAIPAGHADAGVYICTDTSVDPPQSVSINITGGKLAKLCWYNICQSCSYVGKPMHCSIFHGSFISSPLSACH